MRWNVLLSSVRGPGFPFRNWQSDDDLPRMDSNEILNLAFLQVCIRYSSDQVGPGGCWYRWV